MAKEPIAKANFSRLKNLMKDLGHSYSIRVGIIGQKAQEDSSSGLTNAQLGAIHEFGATINVTPKMRAYLASQGMHLKSDTTQIVIPTRSFLRMPLLGKDGKKELAKKVINQYLGSDRELNLLGYDAKFLRNIAELLALEAVKRVQEAFEQGGFGAWPAISEFTKKRRIGSPNNPPLDDTGELKDSITYEIKENK